MTYHLVSVAVRDEPGALARITRQLAGWHINVEGLIADPAGLRFVTKDPDAIERALAEAGIMHRMDKVEKVVLEDRPGALADLCLRLSDASINILTLFGAGSGTRGYVYIAVDNWMLAAPILDAHSAGPSVVTQPRLGRIGLGRIA